MKTRYIVLLSAVLLAASGYSQTSGGAGTGTGTSGTGTSSGANTGGTGSIATRPGLPPPEGFPPQRPLGPNNLQQEQQQQQIQTPQPGLNPQAAVNGTPTTLLSSNGAPLTVDTNQLAANTNQVGTNLTPTSQPGFTNRVMTTNAPVLLTTNSNPLMMGDQALSEGDRRLLFQIRSAVFGVNQAAVPSAGTPVHFILRDGVVRLVGTVPTMEERLRIENVIQQVPGVVRVFDALQVGQPAQPGVQPVGR